MHGTAPIPRLPDKGANVDDATILQQIAVNIRRGLPQARPFAPNDEVAILVCGGPSLNSMEKEIVDEVAKGGKVVAVNGTYQWCLDRNIIPSAMVMIDAREHNRRFLETAVPRCKYMLAGQCHPSAFDACADRDVWIWHMACCEEEYELLMQFYFHKDNFFPVSIGTTVGIRTIQLLRMLGFMRIIVYGLDSCWLGEAHHGYPQAENDRDNRHDVWLVPKNERSSASEKFVCSTWHIKQAQDFQKLLAEHWQDLQLSVRGPGLIATMLRIGARIADEELAPWPQQHGPSTTEESTTSAAPTLT